MDNPETPVCCLCGGAFPILQEEEPKRAFLIPLKAATRRVQRRAWNSPDAESMEGVYICLGCHGDLSEKR